MAAAKVLPMRKKSKSSQVLKRRITVERLATMHSKLPPKKVVCFSAQLGEAELYKEVVKVLPDAFGADGKQRKSFLQLVSYAIDTFPTLNNVSYNGRMVAVGKAISQLRDRSVIADLGNEYCLFRFVHLHRDANKRKRPLDSLAVVRKVNDLGGSCTFNALLESFRSWGTIGSELRKALNIAKNLNYIAFKDNVVSSMKEFEYIKTE
jgi:hypothetical protein